MRGQVWGLDPVNGVNCPGVAVSAMFSGKGAFPSCTVSQLDDLKRVCQLSRHLPCGPRAELEGVMRSPKAGRGRALREGAPERRCWAPAARSWHKPVARGLLTLVSVSRAPFRIVSRIRLEGFSDSPRDLRQVKCRSWDPRLVSVGDTGRVKVGRMPGPNVFVFEKGEA